MKKLILAIALSVAAVSVSQAQVLVNWNFNSNPSDQMTPTGSFAPDQGHGQLRMIGGVQASFAGGNPIDPSPDNTALNTYGYPTQGTGNKTAGIELKVNTHGYYNIRLAFTVRVSEEAAQQMHLQYTIDGSNYLDIQELPLLAASGFIRVSNNFASVAKVDDNANFGLRIVSQFHTLLGGIPTNVYRGSTKPYSPEGRVRFDEVRIWALTLLNGQPPDRPIIPPVTVVENTPQVEVPFPVTAPGFASSDLKVDVYSSNEQLVPTDEISVIGTGAARSLILRPLPQRIGTAMVTLCLSSPEGHRTRADFPLVVTPRDPPPQMGPLSPRSIMMNEPITIPFNIGGGVATSPPVFFTADVSNPTLTPAAQVTFQREGTNQSVSIVPAQNQIGNSTITLSVWDRHRRSASNAFVLSVRPSTDLLIAETFTYHPGSLVTNAPGYWTSHSGTPGQIPIIRGQPWLVAAHSEDVSVSLPGGPYTPGQGDVLYAGFNLICRVLPAASSQYFAHFNTSAFRARVYVTSEAAAERHYRVGIANNNGTPEWYPAELQTEDSHRFVVRYTLASGETKLWMEPNSEQDAGIVATDVPNPVEVTAYAFRENPGMGSLSIDDLKIGTTFDAVARRFPPRFQIQYERNGYGNVTWLDDIYGYVLELSTNTIEGPWKPLDGEPFIGSGGTRVIGLDSQLPIQLYRLRSTNNPPWIFR